MNKFNLILMIICCIGCAWFNEYIALLGCVSSVLAHIQLVAMEEKQKNQ